MQFNQYTLYSLNTQDNIRAGKSKIYDDISQMKTITEYSDILEFIERNYGSLDQKISRICPDNINLEITKEDYTVQVIATKEDKMLIGRRWIFTPDEE